MLTVSSCIVLHNDKLQGLQSPQISTVPSTLTSITGAILLSLRYLAECCIRHYWYLPVLLDPHPFLPVLWFLHSQPARPTARGSTKESELPESSLSAP